MKTFFLLSIATVLTCAAQAQVQNPVKWSFSSKKVSAGTYEVQLTATLDKGWHLYSQTTPEGGPVPTAIEFTKNPLLTLDGITRELGKLEQRHEPLFGVDVKQYSDKVVFVQKVKVKGNAKTSINGMVEYMTCNDRECLPPKKQRFSIALK
jgi:DsbC/DsbD-like thiol-disulfide interchange protein